MNAGTIGGVLDRIVEFERELEDHYRVVRDMSRNNSVKLLTHFLGRHCRDVERVIQDTGSEALGRIWGAELRAEVSFAAADWRALVGTRPGTVKGRKLIELHLSYNMALSEVCRRMLKQADCPDAAALLDGLIRLQEREMLMLQKMLAMHYF